MHQSTRGGANRRFRLWGTGGVSLRRRGVDNYRNADLPPLEIYGEDWNNGRYQLYKTMTFFISPKTRKISRRYIQTKMGEGFLSTGPGVI